jgi:hypothetical protein
MGAFLTLIGTAGGIYLGLAGLLWLAQPHLLYQPNLSGGGIARTPADAGLDYEPVRIATEDGPVLAAWYVDGPSAAPPVVLFFHGNAGNIGDRVESIEQLHMAGAAVLIIDYRGYGQSTGRPSETGTYADARGAWNWLTQVRGVPQERIVLFGRSLGGAIAAHLAARVEPAGLVLESTFTSLPALAAELYPWLPARQLTRYRYNTEAALQKVTAPVLVAHAPGDEIVPFAHARRLARHRPPVVALETLEGGHNDAFLVSQPGYTDTLRAFFRRVTRGDGDEA